MPKPIRKPKPTVQRQRGPVSLSGVSFAPPPPAAHEKRKPADAVKKPKRKNDPKHVAAARELRDRYLEQVNEAGGLQDGTLVHAKYDVSRTLSEVEGSRSLGSPAMSSVETTELNPKRTLLLPAAA